MTTLASTDRLIDPIVLTRRRWKSISRVAGVVLILVIVGSALYDYIRSSVSRAVMHTSVADIGPVANFRARPIN
jgi:hypothetical protein